jgi:cytochrome oxidase Cu insertion factor (SCO1/SenC/PrrC family)
MHNGVNAKSAYITALFNHALFVQLAIFVGAVLVIAVVATVLWKKLGTNLGSLEVLPPGAEIAEPWARKLLRIGFGVLWVIDGLLQLQPEMPIGLPKQVVMPTVTSAPGWVVSLVSSGTNAWLRHPVLAASSTVWLQLGLGFWLLAARRGWWSRAAGLASAGWALCIWVLGNGFGGLYVAPISWMTGAPGAVLFYGLAGLAIAIPPERLRRPLFSLWASRLTAVAMGYFALLQAWPGRGFWTGSGHGEGGALSAMASAMGAVSQPSPAAHLQHWFATFTLHVGWLYNGLVVVVLAASALCFYGNKIRLMRWATVAYVAMALTNWVLVQDFAVFGGVGTDVNSMIPSALLVIAVYFCAKEVARNEEVGEPASVSESAESSFLRHVGATWAIAMFLLGAIPMALVGILPGTSAELASATGAGVQPLGSPAPAFSLSNEDGGNVSLHSLRGKIIVMSFLDPVCTSDCPIEAQQMRLASEQLGSNSEVAFVAVDANPLYRSPATLRAFTRSEGLAGNRSWYFLTGSSEALQELWSAYGVDVQLAPGGGMVAHTEPIYVIDASGHLRATWNAVTGGSSASTLESQSGTALIVEQVRAARS